MSPLEIWGEIVTFGVGVVLIAVCAVSGIAMCMVALSDSTNDEKIYSPRDMAGARLSGVILAVLLAVGILILSTVRL